MIESWWNVHKQLSIDTLASLVQEENMALERESIHSLVLHSDVAKVSVLAELAADTSLNPNLRADAIAGMAALATDQSQLLETLARDKNKTIAAEASNKIYDIGCYKFIIYKN